MRYGLNIGSGQRRFTSTNEMTWLNIDSVARDMMPDVLANGAHLENICDSDMTDVVVLHHVLEHFGCGEAEGLIREAHRVLRPGGSLLVFVPDMQALARRWLDCGLSDQVFMTNVYGAYMGEEADRHRWGYTTGSLLDFLVKSAAWSGVKMFDGRAIPGASICQDWWILGLECIK